MYELKRNSDGSFTVTDGVNTYKLPNQTEALELLAALIDPVEYKDE